MILLDEEFIDEFDRHVDEHACQSRNHAIQEAVSEKFLRLKSNCLATECAKLVAAFEKKIAKKGLDKDVNQ